MSENKETKRSYSFRLNLDELTPDELYAKLKKLENDTLKEAGESISGGTATSPVSVVHGSISGTFSRGADSM
jgi:hypothetical protein